MYKLSFSRSHHPDTVTFHIRAQQDMPNDNEDTLNYLVVVNHEEQYSIWPTFKPIPAGWRATGFTGPKQPCLDYIKSVWTDMRPLSLRQKMDGIST